MSGFDISGIAPVTDREDSGLVVHLRDESGELMYFGDDNTQPVTVTVAGTYSKRYRRALDAKIHKASKARSRDREEIQHDALDVTAQCVIEWAGFFDGGLPLECTRVHAVRVLGAAVWIKDQVEAAMEDHAGFSRASLPN
jgi:hypothetical protein